MECKCDMRTKLVGDGCEVCNPALALSYAKETIAERDARIAELEKALRQTDCKCRQASETPYFYVPVVSHKCPRCVALCL